jgi:hypothetical protein
VSSPRPPDPWPPSTPEGRFGQSDPDDDDTGPLQVTTLSRDQFDAAQRDRVIALGRRDHGLEPVALFPDAGFQPGKSRSRSEFGIRVQRVAVAAHPVQQCLLWQRGQRQLEIRRGVRRRRRRRGPRSPPNPPSPRAKIDRFCVQSGSSGVVTVVSDQITAALPLSQISVKRVTARPVPEGGIGPGMDTASLACSTLGSSMSTPGNRTVGGLVMWKLCATLPNVGSTCGVSSTR